MKQKVTKFKSDLFKQDVTLTVDENLNKLKGKILAKIKGRAAEVILIVFFRLN